MNEYYCIKIKITDDDRVPEKYRYSSVKGELYISKTGRPAGLFGNAELMQFDQLQKAEVYIENNRERFAKHYGRVLLHPVQHITASS